MESLWGISKEEFTNELVDRPTQIIKEQIEYFDKMTKGTLFGHLNSHRIQDPDCSYPIALTFEIVAPNLNGYRYRIFTMYTKAVQEFPVLLFSELEPDEDSIFEVNADYVCPNEKAFVEAICEILKSDDVTNIIKTLFAKSRI